MRSWMLCGLAGLLLIGPVVACPPENDPPDEKSAVSGESLTAAADTPEARKDLARRYYNSPAIQDMNRRMMASFTTNLPAERKDAVMQLTDKLNGPEVELIMVDALTRHFTTPELAFMVTQVTAPEAKAINEKMPAFMTEVFPKVLSVLMQGVTIPACPPPGK